MDIFASFDVLKPARRNEEAPKASLLFDLASRGNHTKIESLLRDLKDGDVGFLVNGFNSLHISAKKNHIDVFRTLCLHSPNLLQSRTSDGRTCEMIATYEGNVGILKLITSFEPTPNEQTVECLDELGQSSLHYACWGGHIESVKYLIEECGTHRCLDRRNNEGVTPLHMAITGKFPNIVGYLMDKLPNKNDDRSDGDPMTNTEKANGDESEENVTSMGYNNFHRAAISGSIEIMQLLLSHEANRQCIAAVTANGSTCLHLSVQNGHLEMTEFLITTLGLDVNASNEYDLRPLHLAAVMGSLPLFQLLLHHGADPTPLTASSQSVLHLAATHGHKVLCKYILSHPTLRIDIFALDTNGNSAVDAACSSGYKALAANLVQYKAEELRISSLLCTIQGVSWKGF